MITDKKGNKYYKIALHIHSTISDGRLSPEQIAKEYKAHGFDAIAITDHWKYGAGGEIDGLKIVSGCEYNTGAADTMTEGVMHILAFGMKSDPQPKRDATRQQIVDAIRAVGGMAVLAHPAWSLNTVEDLRELSGIEATEIYNAVSEAGQSLRPYSGYYVDLCANAGLYPKLLATDDAHYYEGADHCKGWIMAKLDELSEDAILAAIRNGDFYATEEPELYVERIGNKLIIDCSPCSLIGTFSNMSWAEGRVLRGDGLTHFEYEIKPIEKWVRVEVTDSNGKRAYSNVFVV